MMGRACPLWVNKRHYGESAPCPLIPQEQTFVEALSTSVSCHKRTHAVQQKGSLFDHFVSAGEERRRNREAERFRGFEIDDQVDFHGLLDRQISRLGPFRILPA